MESFGLYKEQLIAFEHQLKFYKNPSAVKDSSKVKKENRTRKGNVIAN